MITGGTASQLFTEAVNNVVFAGVGEDSRNGPVRTIPHPQTYRLDNPTKRVVVDPVRMANPFFHLAEVVWMLAGSNEGWFPSFYNSRYSEYLNEEGNADGAYGHRWIRHWGINQIRLAARTIQADPGTRRAVIGMWDPYKDLAGIGVKRDVPCNTQLMFRVHDWGLDMTVINRSNDIVWGMMGANVVHMTCLHELVANMLGLEVGFYYVVTNNAHIYESVPKFEQYFSGHYHAEDEAYSGSGSTHVPMLTGSERLVDIYWDCRTLMNAERNPEKLRTQWAKTVACPMLRVYELRKASQFEESAEEIHKVKATDWRVAAEKWQEWKA